MDIMSLAMARKLRGGGGGSPSGGDSCGIETVVDSRELLAESTFELEYIDEYGYFSMPTSQVTDKYNSVELYTLKLGEIYTVTFNNKDYKCELKMMNGMYYFGSLVFEAQDNYEEPFTIGLMPDNSSNPQILVAALVKDVTISIKIDSVRIKESYIPRPYIFDLVGAGVNSIQLNTPNECYIDQDTVLEIMEVAKRDGVIGVHVHNCQLPHYKGAFFDGNTTPTLSMEVASHNLVIYMHLTTSAIGTYDYIDFAGFTTDGGIAYMRVSPADGKVTTIARAINFMT
jgi:hypothetical protein